MKKQINITIFSDTICGWCYIGKRRLEKAMLYYKNYADFHIEWKPYLLDPVIPEGFTKMQAYERKTGSKERAKKGIFQLGKIGRSVGINFVHEGLISHSLESHRLIHYSKSRGVQDAVVSLLFFEYYEQDKDIGKLDVLLDVAEKCGLDREQIRSYLEGDEDREYVREEARMFREKYQIDGVPYFIIQEKHIVSGAEEVEHFCSIFDKVIQDDSSNSVKEAENSCSIDGTCV